MIDGNDDTFIVSNTGVTESIFRVNGSFGLSCKFDTVTSVAIKIYLGANPEQLVEDTSLAKTLTTTELEAWEIESFMKFAKVEVSSASPFDGKFYVSRFL
jgi:hypothetical protein